jgi:hypothetical protein
LLLFRGAGIEVNSTSAFARYDADKKAPIIQDEADGNSQAFREFHSITQRHRGGGGDCFSALKLPSNEGGQNAQDTSDHDGR